MGAVTPKQTTKVTQTKINQAYVFLQGPVVPAGRGLCNKDRNTNIYTPPDSLQLLRSTEWFLPSLTRPALDFSKLPVADLPEVCLSLLFFLSMKFLRTQQLNLDVMSANHKGLCSLFFSTNLTLKFAKIKPQFLSQETTGLGSCVVTKVSA